MNNQHLKYQQDHWNLVVVVVAVVAAVVVVVVEH
jgi:hypothetical protein